MESLLPQKVTTRSDARAYYHRRAIQGLVSGMEWSGSFVPQISQGIEWGCHTTYRCNWRPGQVYYSLYIYDDHVGQGHFMDWYIQMQLEHSEVRILTHFDCNLTDFFEAKQILFKKIGSIHLTPEYRAVASLYGTRTAKRTGIPFINHIDEGLAVLDRIQASPRAKAAYCLHPIVQMDNDLHAAFKKPLAGLTGSLETIALALEYRNIANAGLRENLKLQNADEISLSPLKDVNDMLVADKVQNYKDFIRYHDGTHKDSDDLHAYFRLWLERLQVSAKDFEDHVSFLESPTTRLHDPVEF